MNPQAAIDRIRRCELRGGGRSGWLLIAALVAPGGCAPKNQLAVPPPPAVTVAAPVEREAAESLVFTGWTEATAAVELRSRVNGYLEKVLFEDGAVIKEGEPLFVIEQQPFETSLAAAEAELQKAEAALHLSQTEFARTRELVSRNVQTQAELDVDAAELETAKANVSAAQAVVRRAKLDLTYTVIRAPLGGQIGRRLVDPGNLVQAEQTLLAKIESIDPIYAYFSVSENDLLRFMRLAREQGMGPDELRKNPPAINLALADEEGFSRTGRFDFSERTIDRATGTALRRGVFDNADGSLIPGLFVRVEAPLGKPRPRLFVEERAVSTDQQGEYLLVLDDKNVVQYRPVKLGPASGGLRVVESGVQLDERIIINGLQRARPGTTVVPQEEGATSAGAQQTASQD